VIRRCLLSAAALFSVSTHAAADEAGDALARRIAERHSGEGRVGVMHFKLVNARGATRNRSALMLHSEKDDAVRIAIHFREPAAIQDTAFLSHDNPDRADENWLYLPATQRVRRIPASDRGDYFMGTDLTYGDVKDDFKFGLDDWSFAYGGEAPCGEKTCEKLTGVAASPDIARETGYGAFAALIDPDTLFPAEVRYDDPEGEPLKRVRVTKQEIVGDAWTAMEFEADNLQSGHRTRIWFTNMTYRAGLDLSVFDPDTLDLGAPELL